MKKAIFLDRDGTIIEEKNYLSKKEDVKILEYAIDGLKLLQDSGYMLFIVSNQSGVARGYFSEETVNEINNYLKELLALHKIVIDEISYCPHLKTGKINFYKQDCDCRKPKTGMIMNLVKKYDIDLSKSYIIGDKMSDLELAKNCNCKGIIVLTGKVKKAEITKELPIFAKNLLSAAEIILKK